MGLVYHARDGRLGRQVALKLMRPELLHHEQLRRRFTSEASMSARLDHPGIVNVHDYGETSEGCPYIVMEWLEGSDLAALLRDQGPGSSKQVAQVLEQAAWALSYAHELKFVHRDIKPANLFISTANGELRTTLLDFGVAKHVETDSFGTRPGSMVGTPLYMAPEQLVGAKVDHRSDIFSLAALGYEALTGMRARASVNECLSRPLSRVTDRLEWSEDTPALVRKAFGRALSWDPSRRPDDARRWVESFISDLRDVPGPKGWRIV
jgi:serine/threonine protein kinase